MNDNLSVISDVLKVFAGAEMGALVSTYFFDEDYIIILRTLIYAIAFVSIILNFYFKWKQAKIEIEIKEFKRQQAENEKNGRFVFGGDYREKPTKTIKKSFWDKVKHFLNYD